LPISNQSAPNQSELEKVIDNEEDYVGKAIMDYTGLTDDELSFKKGDIIRFACVDVSGWAFGCTLEPAEVFFFGFSCTRYDNALSLRVGSPSVTLTTSMKKLGKVRLPILALKNRSNIVCATIGIEGPSIGKGETRSVLEQRKFTRLTLNHHLSKRLTMKLQASLRKLFFYFAKSQ